jgi:2-keto-4-pentenoate hydratase/2-oxohepta-3-ene-1,7-dioic acid hydratase in catechol pathway
VALERDGALYDVEALAAAAAEWGADVIRPDLAWDFHTRVAVLGGAGLRELDAELVRGRRPAEARITEEFAPLAPCETDRAMYVHVDVRTSSQRGEPVVRVGDARALSGQDALVDLPRGETSPDFEAGVAVVVGDDLADATRAEARSAAVGYAVLVDWCARDAERAAAPGLESVKGLRAQIGPVLAGAATVPSTAGLAVRVRHGAGWFEAGTLRDLGISIEDAVAFASSRLELRSGDVVGVGPLPRGTSAALGFSLGYHEPIEVSIDRVGTLRGAAVPRR